MRVTSVLQAFLSISICPTISQPARIKPSERPPAPANNLRRLSLIVENHRYFFIEHRPVVLSEPEFCSMIMTGAGIKVDQNFCFLNCFQEAFKIKLLKHHNL